jgi:ribosomal protein S12 methylthiotransferase
MQEEKICSYLDIPFQHSSSAIVKKMKRTLDGKSALRLIRKIRKKIPDIALRTSLVVGFPGEGKDEFEELKKFVLNARFDHLGVFLYSREEGTESFSLGNPVREEVKEKRREKIMEIQAEISYLNNKKYMNKTIDVILEGAMNDSPHQWLGRGRFQAPEVDGIVLIDSSLSSTQATSAIQKVEIINWDVYDLYGKIP